MFSKVFVALAKQPLIQEYFIRKYKLTWNDGELCSNGELISYGGNSDNWKLDAAIRGFACNRLVQILTAI